VSTIDTRPHSERRDWVTLDRPHYWLERKGMWKVRFGSWVFVGQSLDNAHRNYLYWSMQSNEKP
jgi:hypothetical protein